MKGDDIMVKRTIKLTKDIDFSPCDSISEKIFTLNNFVELHEKFINLKVLEGVRERTLQGYKENFNYLNLYLFQQLGLGETVELKTEYFYEYMSYMKLQKSLANNTINIRLRTIKAYLRWLHNEGYISDFHSKLKLMKTPVDTVQPVKSSDIKKVLKAINLKEYTGLRDYAAIILILDCGIRIKELLNLKIEDINLKQKIIRCYKICIL